MGHALTDRFRMRSAWRRLVVGDLRRQAGSGGCLPTPVLDELWDRIAPLLPPGQERRHRYPGWRRLRDWTEAGVWPTLHRALLTELRAADALAMDDCAVDESTAGCGSTASSHSSPRNIAHGFGLGKTRRADCRHRPGRISRVVGVRDVRVVLIGGTSNVGKSTVAQVVAERLGFECLSTDGLARHPG